MKTSTGTRCDSAGQSFWLCRHGNRIDFVDKGWKGVDPHLAADGIVQARETGARLRGEPIRHIFASPFYRAVETAHHIAEALDLPIKVEYGACEWLNPAWFAESPACLTLEALHQRFPRVDRSYTSRVQPRYPETNDEMLARCRECARLLEAEFDEDLLVIGHGASVSGLTEGFLGRKHGLSCCGVCSLTRVVLRDGIRELVLHGDASHLTGGGTHAGRFT